MAGSNCLTNMPARNQGACGSCVLFGTTTTLSLNYCKAAEAAGQIFDTTPVFSAQGIMSCGTRTPMTPYGSSQMYSNGCEGGLEGPIFAWLRDVGVALTSCNPVVTNSGAGEDHFDAQGEPSAYPVCRTT